jgi:hypothetical protein
MCPNTGNDIKKIKCTLMKCHTNDNSNSSTQLELVPTVMIDDLDKSCAKADPNFDK